MDPVTVLIILLALDVAFQITTLRAARRRKRKRAVNGGEDPQPVCGCDHHYAFHDPTTGHCHATSKVASKWDYAGYPVAYTHQQCGCRQYVGPQPLETYYAPEITGDTTITPRLTKGDDCQDGRPQQ